MEEKLLVEKLVAPPWWDENCEDLYSPDFALEMPFAPPGVAQYPCAGQLWGHKQWLRKTVREWKTSLERIFAPADPASGVYFAVYTAEAKVHWGGVDGEYKSRTIDRFTIRDGKVVNLRKWFNPLEWLRAAGRELPLFQVEIPWDDVPKYRAARLEREAQPFTFDPSPEAAKARMAQNVTAFCASTSAENHKTFDHPTNYDRTVYWLPPVMKEHVEGDEVDQMEAWTWASMHDWKLMEDAVAYPTEDPLCFFFETGGYGDVSWLGNHSHGGYQNRYIKYMEMDENGFIIKYGEYVNPINKFNSINVSIPTFPWLY